MTAYTILGNGAVGRTLAALLGDEVEIFSRRAAATVPKSIRLSTGRTCIVPIGPVPVLGHPSDTSPSPLNGKVLVVCSKANDLEELLRPLAGAHLDSLVLASNGLGVAAAVRALFPRTPIARLLLNFGMAEDKEGQVIVHGDPRGVLAYEDDHSSFVSLENDLVAGGMALVRTSNIRAAEWGKVGVNAVVNSICSIAGRPNGAIAEVPALHAMAALLHHELMVVSAAAGYPNAIAPFEGLVNSIASHGSNFNSTLQDLRRGRPTETPFLLGAVVREATALGIDTPNAAFLLFILNEIERGASPVPPLS